MRATLEGDKMAELVGFNATKARCDSFTEIKENSDNPNIELDKNHDSINTYLKELGCN